MIDIFDEFFKIVAEFNAAGVRYAVIGGIAMAFHVQPRYTKDIDFLVLPEDLPRAAAAFDKVGYFESSAPWTFKSSNLTLHRFMHAEGEEFLIVDILVGNGPEYRRIIDGAVLEESKAGTVRVASKEHMIWLKRARNSDQDRVDIKGLQGDQN